MPFFNACLLFSEWFWGKGSTDMVVLPSYFLLKNKSSELTKNPEL